MRDVQWYWWVNLIAAIAIIVITTIALSNDAEGNALRFIKPILT
jgi:hypothetical protein